jgi:hypothetical protein
MLHSRGYLFFGPALPPPDTAYKKNRPDGFDHPAVMRWGCCFQPGQVPDRKRGVMWNFYMPRREEWQYYKNTNRDLAESKAKVREDNGFRGIRSTDMW